MYGLVSNVAKRELWYQIKDTLRRVGDEKGIVIRDFNATLKNIVKWRPL